jgi:hypothetical protein
VGYRDELNVTGSDPDTLTISNLNELRSIKKSGFSNSIRCQAHGERRTIDRRFNISQEVRQTPNMILVPMRQDDPIDSIRVLAQKRQVGKDQVNPRHVWLWEHDANINDEKPALNFNTGAVSANLA